MVRIKNFEDCIACLFYYSLFYNFRRLLYIPATIWSMNGQQAE